MPSRSVRRRRHKQLAAFDGLSEGQRRAVGTRHLAGWRAEAIRRASSLGEPAVWQLEADVRPQALALDTSGELAEELSRICAEAVSRASGKNLVSDGRGRADRARLNHRGGTPSQLRS